MSEEKKTQKGQERKDVTVDVPTIRIDIRTSEKKKEEVNANTTISRRVY